MRINRKDDLMKYYLIFVLAVISFLLSCETYSTRDLERDNPYPFVVRAIIKQGGDPIKFEDRNARMICDDLPAYEECVPCEYDNPNYMCIYDKDSGVSFTADSCMCKGHYHIISQKGLEIVIMDPKKARTPATFITEIDAKILYMNRPLRGKVMLTKSEIGTIITQSGNSVVQLSDSYFLDVAGGFEATDGVVNISGGIFYSQKPDEE